MGILIDVLLIIVGVVIVLWGADRLTEGSVAIASKIGVSQLVIGLTVVALGTSMPEFCVSFVSALKGTADMAVGNVVRRQCVWRKCCVAVFQKEPCIMVSCAADNQIVFF